MCTGRYPAAIWDPITDRDTAPNVIERMTIHTAWVDAGDIYGPNRGQSRTYGHFYNPDNGRLRQHQEVTRMARADLDANGRTVAVEHQDPRRDAPMTSAQLDADARLFAHLVLEHGTPNRIATVDDTRGLAWHRLGVDGNFGPFDPNNRRTWCRKQTGQRWTTVYGKTCPTNPRIDQIPLIWQRAQEYITAVQAPTPATPTQSRKDVEEVPKAIIFSSPRDGGDSLYVAFPNAREYDLIEDEAERGDYTNILTRQGFDVEEWRNSSGSSKVGNPDVFGRYVGPAHLKPSGAKREA